MYARSYYPEEEKIKVPENYDGNALREQPAESDTPISLPLSASIGETKISPREDIVQSATEECESCAASPKEEGEKAEAGLFERLPLKKLFQGKLGNFIKLDGLKIGSEEILIAAVALFLFFSKEGDKECAIILLLLLFVN